MSFNPEIHRRRSIRLQDYDYSSGGAYSSKDQRQTATTPPVSPKTTLSPGGDGAGLYGDGEDLCRGYRSDFVGLRSLNCGLLSGGERAASPIWCVSPDHRRIRCQAAGSFIPHPVAHHLAIVTKFIVISIVNAEDSKSNQLDRSEENQ